MPNIRLVYMIGGYVGKDAVFFTRGRKGGAGCINIGCVHFDKMPTYDEKHKIELAVEQEIKTSGAVSPQHIKKAGRNACINLGLTFYERNNK